MRGWDCGGARVWCRFVELEVKRREMREFVEGGVLWVHLFTILITGVVVVGERAEDGGNRENGSDGVSNLAILPTSPTRPVACRAAL